MAHRRPRRGDVQLHDGLLLQTAAVACGNVLMTDLRIQKAYDTWVTRHDLTRLSRRYLAWRTAATAEPFQRALWGGAHADEIETLAALLTTMQTPWPWVSPQLLFHHFPTRYATELSPAHPPRFVRDIEMAPTAQPDRRPRSADLESLECHVVYWYRHEVKHPPDAIWELEEAERRRSGQHYTNRRHSTVIQGIQRVKYLFGLIDGYEITLERRQK